MRGTALILALLSIGAVPPQQVTWTHTTTPEVAQKYSYKLYIYEESGKKSIVTLVNTLCGVNNGITQCSTGLPATGNIAIITGNQSQITATDTTTQLESGPSLSFTGNQGCILRDNLYKIAQQTQLNARKDTLATVRAEAKAAKFKEIRIQQKGNNFVLTEECVGYIVQ